MSFDGHVLYKQRKNLLDIYQVGANRVGIFRESFERVMELDGFELTPSGEVHEIWNFTNSISGLRGRLINVDGYLGDSPLALTTRGRAYLVTRQEFTLGLLFPGAPRRLKLSEIRYRVLPDKEQRAALPLLWPVDAVDRVIRHRFRNIIILEDGFFWNKSDCAERWTPWEFEAAFPASPRNRVVLPSGIFSEPRSWKFDGVMRPAHPCSL